MKRAYFIQTYIPGFIQRSSNLRYTCQYCKQTLRYCELRTYMKFLENILNSGIVNIFISCCSKCKYTLQRERGQGVGNLDFNSDFVTSFKE